MKIETTIRLDDGQKIYIMSKYIIHRHFKQYMRECAADAYIFYWNQEQQLQRAMSKFIKDYCPELSEWLIKNKYETSFWVDPELFKVWGDSISQFLWGIGFRHNDPKETMFTLRWS